MPLLMCCPKPEHDLKRFRKNQHFGKYLRRWTFKLNKSINHDCDLEQPLALPGSAKHDKNNRIYNQKQKALYFAMLIVLMCYTYKLQHQSYPNLKFEA